MVRVSKISLKITIYDISNHYIFSNLPAAQIKKNFVPPKRATIHFDGKILTDLANETGDHLAVVLSGDTPQCQQGKLLSARRIDDGTGESQAEEVIESLKDWKAIDYVVAQCFDTTSSNTGTYFELVLKFLKLK